MRYQAVLFDFDGTLADTMASHYKCWAQVFKEVGIRLKEADYYPMEGASLHRIARHFSGVDEENIINALVKKKNNFVNLQVIFLPYSLDMMPFKLTRLNNVV